MNGKQLKNSILQWAIQGKLVPQDPNDEPASVLLEKIRQEKERLIKEKKIKRDKNASIIYRGEDNSYYEKFLATGEVKCIDEEIPFEVPQGWEWCRVSSVFLINPKVSANDDDIAAFIPMEAISAGYGSEFRFYEKQWKEIKSGYTAFEDNDIAFAKITPCFQNRKSAIFQGLPNGIGAGTTELKILRTYGETINRYYVLYFLETPYFIDEATFKGTANQQRIIVGYLENKLFPLAPLAEQNRIVDKIGILMPIIDKYSKSQETLDKINVELNSTLKKSILQEAIQGKLVPQIAEEGTAQELLEQIQQEKQKLVKKGKLKKSALTDSVIYKGDDNKYYEQVGKVIKDITEEIRFDLPEKWQWCRIGSLFMHNNGKQLNKGNTKGKLMEYITTSNLYWDGFVLENLKKMPFEYNEIERCMAVKGDLLVCEGGDIGRSCIWSYNFPIMLQNHIHKLRPYISVCTRFFYYIFYLYNLTGLIGGKDVGIQGFSSKALHNTLIPLPPLQEQQRIVAQIERLFEQLK
ncbi:MAG: restriction endonuclease subunit S [Paraprevotella sp.]|nr:restriction endonuclease subunit S [Paraprevotella sp.]